MIDPDTIGRLLRQLAVGAGLHAPRREPIRIWDLSGVERLHLSDGSTVVFKYATAPFLDEHLVLVHAAEHGVPVPELFAVMVLDGVGGMICEDLGEPEREAREADAADMAVRLHAAGSAPGLSTLDEATLAGLPGEALASLAELWAAGRFRGTGDLLALLVALDLAAPDRSAGADLTPFGLCHGEFHPTSVHVGAHETRLLDLAKAHNGPGLLDLATWYGTRNPPDPHLLRLLIDKYIAAGGHPDALTPRGGLPAETWALGWHRVHSATWFLEQSAAGVFGPADDARHIAVLRRQLGSAAALLS